MYRKVFSLSNWKLDVTCGWLFRDTEFKSFIAYLSWDRLNRERELISPIGTAMTWSIVFVVT